MIRKKFVEDRGLKLIWRGLKKKFKIDVRMMFDVYTCMILVYVSGECISKYVRLAYV